MENKNKEKMLTGFLGLIIILILGIIIASFNGCVGSEKLEELAEEATEEVVETALEKITGKDVKVEIEIEDKNLKTASSTTSEIINNV